MSSNDWMNGPDPNVLGPSRAVNRPKDAIDASDRSFQVVNLINTSEPIPVTGIPRSVDGEGANIMAMNGDRVDSSFRKVYGKLMDLLESDPASQERAGISAEASQYDLDGRPKRRSDQRSRVQESYDDDDDLIGSIRTKKAPAGSWAVVDLMAKSESTGARIPVWKVLDEENDKEIKHIFRIEEAAVLACEYLNQGLRDKAKSMVDMDQRRFALAKKARALKESGNKAEHSKVLREIAQINVRLGL